MTAELTARVIGSAMKVHTSLGAGLLESVYQICLEHDLRQQGLNIRAQVPLPVTYEGIRLEGALRLDLLVDDQVIVEVKAVDEIAPVHLAQLLTYLRPGNKPIGLLINFNVPHLRNGIRRLVNNYREDPRRPSASPASSAVSSSVTVPDPSAAPAAAR